MGWPESIRMGPGCLASASGRTVNAWTEAGGFIGAAVSPQGPIGSSRSSPTMEKWPPAWGSMPSAPPKSSQRRVRLPGRTHHSGAAVRPPPSPRSRRAAGVSGIAGKRGGPPPVRDTILKRRSGHSYRRSPSTWVQAHNLMTRGCAEPAREGASQMRRTPLADMGKGLLALATARLCGRPVGSTLNSRSSLEEVGHIPLRRRRWRRGRHTCVCRGAGRRGGA